jgi:Xaa-Pro dipeptidase
MNAESSARKALEANRAAYDALRAELRSGMTELDALRIVEAAVDSVCGAEEHGFVGDFVGGARSGAIEGPATGYVFKPGDAFILDLSVRRGGAWSDTCRTFFFGEPSAAQRDAYWTVLAAQSLAEGLVRAGTVAETVKEAVDEFLAARGYAGMMPHHVGHMVGEKPYMKPAFEAGDRSIVKAGDICTLEPGLYFKDSFGIRVENDYLIGTDGVVDLFGYPREMENFIL